MTRTRHSRRTAFSLLLGGFVLAAHPALASDKKKAKEGEGEPKADPVIKLQAMALPIIADGRVMNYVFVELSLTLAPHTEATAFAGKEPLLRDKIVRLAHRTPFTRPDSYVALDEPRLKAAVLREAVALAGAGKIASVTVIKQTPKNRVAPPAKPSKP
jgi:hypothetical protein